MNKKSNFKDMSIQALRRSGARITKPRLAVIECLEQASDPLSAKDIIASIQTSDEPIDIDPVTAYRILDRFRDLGLVHQVSSTGRYVTCTHFRCHQHYHVLLRCRDCHQVQERDLPDEVISPLFWYLKKTLDFQTEPHVLQLEGLCGACEQAASSADGD